MTEMLSLLGSRLPYRSYLIRKCSPETDDDTSATAELFSSNNSLSTSYVGLGWFVDTNLGTEIIQHSGSIDGYRSYMGFNPDKQVGIRRIM